MAMIDLDTPEIIESPSIALYNPLAFDLTAAVQKLQSCLQNSPPFCVDTRLVDQFLVDPKISKSDLLDTIARLMINPVLTLDIVQIFRPIAIDLIARWATPGFTFFLEAVSTNVSGTVHRIETVAKAFSLVLPVVPQVKSLAVTYFTHSPSLFERLSQLPQYENATAKDITPAMTQELQSLLQTTYRLLCFSTSTFGSLWNWGPVVQLLSYPDTYNRYFAVLCLSKVYGLADIQTKRLLGSLVGGEEHLDSADEPLVTTIDNTRVDMRMIRLWEQQQLAISQFALVKNDYATDSGHALSDSDLCSLTCNLCGVLLPKTLHSTNRDSKVTSNLVLTETTSRNLHAISLALSIGAPTLLEGVTGAGKTALVEELANRTGRSDQLVKIHLGDQTDPKVLLGTYVSTSTPGSFRWQEGVLTTAVQEGRWVLIEDIDLAPAEVLSVLLPLLETRHLFIPSRGEKIKAKEGFQLFGTRSFVPSRSGRVSSRGGDLVTGANLWTRVHVDPLSMEELEAVVRQKFPVIGDFAVHVMTLFKTVIGIYQDPHFAALASSTMGRFISTRDLMKWCCRIETLMGNRLHSTTIADAGLDEQVRQDLFSEAIDCFCGMIPDYNTWILVLEKVGVPLQISEPMVRHYVDQYKPAFEVTESTVRVGRVNLSSIAASGKQKQKQGMVKRERQRPFAVTGHALRLLERLAVCVHLTEPVLLVGETGTGKTTVVQHLADMMHQNLIVVNLSQQSDSSDLLGGFKPVDGKVLAIPLREEFERLFEKTFSVKKNAKFMEMVRKTFVHQKWANFVTLLQQAVKMSQQKFEKEEEGSAKRTSPELRSAWKVFSNHLVEFQVQQVQSANKFVFHFLEGSLVKAVRQGDWILLDEINLATTETLECLSGLLQDAHGSLLLTEKGDVEPIRRHPNFRLFACMNPATDVGKRDLPPGLRNRFTEFYVHPPDSRYEDLLQIVRRYLVGISTGNESACDDVAEFYMEAKKLSSEHKLTDGANQRPHFSMRTLARALTYVVQIFPTYGLRRSLYEGFCMTFLTQLSKESEVLMRDLIHKTILRSVKNPSHLISQIPRQPDGQFIQFGYFWLEQGQFEPYTDDQYIMTPSVETKLHNLARVIMSRKFPVLIQGPTSAGKTSMIEFMAKKTGHRFVRINNHEHTDLQEYLGTYVSNADGQLVFQEGVLVEALRNGYWIVLDELNLAPSDVLEALNRLLDDNRELLIPETQEVVKPHPHFMLFATQNPAGLYGGRKALSRAFRNRFLELHFDDIPEEELETILSRRCRIAPSYCKKLVQVYKALMERRQSTRIFEQKHGFITLRDLFRWAGRDPTGYQELAEHGYMLLAERCRKDEEKRVVKQVLESVMRVKIEEEAMYGFETLEEFAIFDKILKEKAGQEDGKLVWTKAMRRLFSLVARCLRFKEPVLLVGETGCGKTTVCQMLAETFNRELHIVNCHQNTETGDLLGGQRPVRHHTESDTQQKQLFEWHDGPLVQSMKSGHLFLLDEISLADDSVLERLNSVLEPSRLLVLAEKGGKHVEELYGSEGFQFLATMNPGGDYGKKELSPALRNRFTEIWVPAVSDRDDLVSIIEEQMTRPGVQGYSNRMLDFVDWFAQALGQSRVVVSLRDILSWVKFINTAVDQGIPPHLSYVHGGCLVLLDGLGSHGSSGSFLSGAPLREFRLKCLRQLANEPEASEKEILGEAKSNVKMSDDQFAIGAFHIPRGQLSKADIKFTLLAPTTADNAMRVVRAMQVNKPILLEGSPGVGKTSLVSALAAASGHRLVRINLSEQTDLMDLFGSDLPVEGGSSGEFAWRDAPFLQAMKDGDWVLLDELNLASQSVLEGLNSCLDHRGAVYIPELDREFFCAKEFRVFGAQNPLQQGGGRKGLPKSFINRFTQVYVEHLSADDLLFICAHLFPQFKLEIMKLMIKFNARMYEETMVRCSFGRKGSPWEFNLRDVFRWLELMQKDNVHDPAEFLDIIYLQRMRTHEDRIKIGKLYEEVFGVPYSRPQYPEYHVSPNQLVVGHSRLPRKNGDHESDMLEREDHLLQSFLPSLEALIKCVESNWMAILTGPSASGKTSLVRLLSKMTGNRLEEFAMNNSVDTMELLGGFEQVDLNRHRQVVMDTLSQLTSRASKALLMYLAQQENHPSQCAIILEQIRQLNDAWFTLESRQNFRRLSDEPDAHGLDYTLVSRVLTCLDGAAGLDEEAHTMMTTAILSIKNLQRLEKESVAGKFEWIDGLLIHALEQGHWLLIDNANLCNPSVLDRLNPLFENDGVLMVNERGLVDGTVKIIKPHPNFRMFMTVDPQNGELSRAMRNRGIEISLVDSDWNKNPQDVTKVANALGLRGPNLPLILYDLQEEVAAKRKHFGRRKNVRDYLLFTTYAVERLQRGQSVVSAIHEAFRQVFVDVTELPESLVKLLADGTPEAVLENMVSPTNSPYFIGGTMFQEDSVLATVSIQGAYLLSLLQQPPSEDEAADMRRIEVAVDYFMESLTSEDYGLRLRWLAFMVQHGSVTRPAVLERLGYLIKTSYTHPVFGEYRKLQLVYEQEREASLDVRPSLTLVHTHKTFLMFVRLCKQEYENIAMQNATKRLNAGGMTPLQQSFCFREGRLSETQLAHPVVSMLFPLFEAIKESYLSWINESFYRTCPTSAFDVLNRLLDCRDYAWSLAQSPTLSLDNFLIILRIMKSLMTIEDPAPIFFAAPCDLINEIMSNFDFETCRSMKSLWNYFSPATLSSVALFDLETELREIDATMDSYLPSNENGLEANDLVLRAKPDVKAALVEGIATLYAVNENDDKDAIKLAKSLQHLPEYIRRQMEAEGSVVPAAENITTWDTALLPLFDYASLSTEMELVASLYAGSCDLTNKAAFETLVEKIKEFKADSFSNTSRPPLDMVPYQRLMWFLDSDYENKIAKNLPSMVQDASHIWHRRLWRSSVFQKNLYSLIPSAKTEVDLGISSGSLSLFESVETMACLNILCSVEKMSADAYENALNKLKSLKQLLATNTQLKDKRALEIIMLSSLARQLLNASSDVLLPSLYDKLCAHFDKLTPFVNDLLNSTIYTVENVREHYDVILSVIAQISIVLEDANMNAFYTSAVEALSETIRHFRSKDLVAYFKSAGKTRVLLGLAFVSAYVPDYPVDPTSEPRLRVDLLTKKKQECLDIINVRSAIETLYTGNKTNPVVEGQKFILSQVNESLAKSSTTFSLRPTKSQLDDIFVDLRYLQKSMLERNVETLMQDLEDTGMESVMQREALLQGNALQFLDRVQAKYPMYRDILQPLLVAVDDIKYGLRIMTSHHRNDATNDFLAQVVEMLIRGQDGSELPTDLDCHTLASPDTLAQLKEIIFERASASNKWSFYLRILIIVLQRLVMSISGHGYIRLEDMSCLNVVFNEIVQIWKAAQVYKRQKEIERDQMYKTRAKKYEPLTDEEQEELDMRKTFADFNEVYEDLVEDNEPTAKSGGQMNTPNEVEEESVLDDTDTQRIGHLHKMIFDTFRHDVCAHFTKSWDREVLQAYTMAGQLAKMASSAFSSKTDRVCNAGNLRIASMAIRRLESEDSFGLTSDDIYDFYKSENVGEAKRVEPVIRRFKNRVMEILAEWPEHAVLQQIIAVCDRILGFSILSPVAQFLTGIELLLQKSEDWEAYAAKHVSIQAQRDELVSLIVRWRQLELNCWPKLLAAQEQYSQDAAFTWWFHLYDALNNTSFELGTEEEKGKKTKELLTALDQFVQVSTLVEFEPRLKMVDSFYRQARMQAELAQTDGERLSHETVATVLRNVYLYYDQFRDHARTYLAQLRKPIEKDLKDFVKIASWKDINIYALRQSAQKTHRQLHKCIRKYREILGHTMLTIIATYNQEQAMFQYGDDKRYDDTKKGFVDQLDQPKLWLTKTNISSTMPIEWPVSAQPVKRHLANLQSTLNRMRLYCREDVFVADNYTKELPLETFMTDIINQIKHFQKETPAVMTDENKSMVKLQKLQKKKALVDFLKELKRLGLKWRATTLAEQNADTSQLFRLKSAELDYVLMNRDLQKQDLSTHGCTNQDTLDLWNKANSYYYRSIARLTHLRNLSTTQVHKDLSMLEVERCMSTTEYAFSLVTKERAILNHFEERMSVLQGVCVQLASFYDAYSRDRPISHDATLGRRLTHQKLAVDTLVIELSQATITMKLQTEYTTSSAYQQALTEMENLCATVRKIQKTIDYTFSQRYLYPETSTRLGFSILSEDVEEMIEAHYDSIDAMEPALMAIIEQVPQSSHSIYPILNHISTARTVQAVSMDDQVTTVVDVRDKLYSLIDAILVSIQDLKKAKTPAPAPVATPDEEQEEEQVVEDMEENYIRLQHNKQFELSNALHFEVITKRCLDALKMCHQLSVSQSAESANEVSRLLQDTYPFLQQYMLVVQHTLGEIVVHHKSTVKLSYALVNSFTIIISKGFCMPEGASDEEEGEGEGVGTGTGIGEGQGNKDVSEEIEDEEQVLGTQNEEQQKNEKQDSKEEKNGMEMENDFDGELEDVEQDDQEKDEDDSSDEDEEMDDEIGDVDDMDPDAVDDKMWGDEGDDKLNESDKTVDQDQGQSEQKESDIVAKEEEDGKQPEKKGEKPDSSEDPQKQQEQEAGEESEGDGEGEGDDQMDDEGEDAEDGEDGMENNPGDKFNADIPEAETLELPDDLNMDGDGDEEEQGEDKEEFFDAMDAEAPPEEGEQVPDEEEEGEAFHDPLNDATEAENKGDEDEEMADATAHMDNEDDEEAGGENGEEEGEEEKDEASKEVGDSEKRSGQIDEEEPEENTKGQNHEQPNSDDSADNQFGVQGEAGKTSMSSVGKKEGENETAESAEADVEQEKNKEKTGTAERGANETNNDEPEDGTDEDAKQPKTNPQRSLGDALESWRRRLADVADAEDEEEEGDNEDETKKTDQEDSENVKVNEDNAFEYVKNDDEAHDMQTLGNAAADQLQDMQLGAMDEDTEDTEKHAGEMDIDEDPESTVDTMPLPRDTADMGGENDTEGVILSKRAHETQNREDTDILTADESLVAHEPLEQEDIERMREELENKVSEWREEGRGIDKARELWQSYENLTHDLAMGLCEQLRLILEPTLATKLKGDYRTGKRLNMKKIIPYIASQFKKDKIWLRRTKPSKRQYQVMISVDDSKSMSESHCVQLAYETLSLISKAMSQLEVGDISITSFGERIRLLHPFDQPFTSESGASVLQQFTFAQQKTYVKNLVETSLSLFESAKHSSGPGNAELWQLQLIISDGICEDHETLKALVRKAMEQQVMIIFIVVDNKPEKDSIMNMTNVKYATVNGKLSLQMSPYLETFPFQYFMILRDINALPEALSDALRQYFSFVAA